MNGTADGLGRRTILAAAAAACLSRPARAAAASTASISFDAAHPGRVVPPRLFGSNLQWTSGGDGALVQDASGDWNWAPNLVTDLKSSGLKFLRFPGGDLANTYNWAAGTGGRAGRPNGTAYDGSSVPSTFGTDELIALSSQVGMTETLLTVNLSAGQSAACDWIDYLTNSGPQPHLGVTYVEVGNELYATGQNGSLDATDYGTQVASFASAIHARFPNVQVGAMLEGSFQYAAWMANVQPDLLTWNQQVLQAAGTGIDFASLHFGAPYDTLPDPNALDQLVWAAPIVLANTLAEIEGLTAQYSRPSLPLVMSEYTTFFGGNNPPDQSVSSTQNALFDALCLFTAMRDPNVVAASNWSLLNNSNFGLFESDSTGTPQPRPNEVVFKALTAFAGRQLLPMTGSSPTYSVAAQGNVPAMSAVPMIDGAAVLTGTTVVAALVNRSATQTVPATVQVKGRTTTQMAGSAYVPANANGTAWATPAVLSPASQPGGGLLYQLPPASFSLLMLSYK